MGVRLTQIDPGDIEAESFRIIERELGPTKFDQSSFKIVQRVIHATGDFSFADNIRISPGAIDKALEAIRQGKNILTDVNMVVSGISKHILAHYGGEVICKVADPEIAVLAKAENKTRSQTAICKCLDDSIGIIAMGNAPTALIESIRVIQESKKKLTPVIVGVPVGFVNAVESKDLLVEQYDNYITSLGRKGGSPVAAAIVNALLRLTHQ